jgi:hypothetical protein
MCSDYALPSLMRQPVVLGGNQKPGQPRWRNA